MYARLIYEGATAWPFKAARIPKGKTFAIELAEAASSGYIWPAEPDDVLDIRPSKDGKRAEIKATAIGRSSIEIQRGVGTVPLLILVIHVYEDTSNEAVGFKSTVGEEIPDP